ncbi:uncharacterized protein LOC131537994 isoform X2 [Onychostoma macrolepis]|uniref:uncharacterized protein LOC131537994 isoform X2 n=1 Tax=Onychostoma macrolepis TaxID=369639 RepID=UPI00272CC8B9|nr:uncharacterized protein LOC131537994 isoform X2 [Onychostoma macrolepis]
MTGVSLAFGIDDVYSGTGSCSYCTAGVTSIPEHFQAKHLKHAIYFEDNGNQKYCIPCFCLKSQQRKRCHWHCPKCQHILCHALDLKKHLHNHDFAVMDKVPNKPEEGPTENPKARQHVGQEQPPVICIDERNGVFVTPKDVHGPRVPIHYALYVALNWEFDFTQHDMAHIWRWWVNLIFFKMTHARKKRCTSAMSEAFKEETKQQEKLPDAVLLEILLHVVLEEGDAALLNLSLVCSKFRSLVDTDSFRKRAHFFWLDSVTNWRTKSEPCQEFFKMYTLQPC